VPVTVVGRHTQSVAGAARSRRPIAPGCYAHASPPRSIVVVCDRDVDGQTLHLRQMRSTLEMHAERLLNGGPAVSYPSHCSPSMSSRAASRWPA
jgi:hypothetical protein